MDNGIFQAFKAEALLSGSDILERIANLRKNLQYTTEGETRSFDDYVAILRQDVDAIPKLELESDVVPGTENMYSIQLVTSMEQIVDECDRVQRKLAHFQGRLKDAERQINNIKSEFMAWYALQASALLANLEDIKLKLPAKEIRSLAEAEFSRLMGSVDLMVETILNDLKLEFERVAQHKSTQKEKHNLGKDQANASWTSTLPSFGGAIPENQRTDKYAAPQEEEEDLGEAVPAFVSRKPKIADVQSDEIKGTFKKTITAATTVIKDEGGEPVVIEEKPKPPRTRLLLDEEII